MNFIHFQGRSVKNSGYPIVAVWLVVLSFQLTRHWRSQRWGCVSLAKIGIWGYHGKIMVEQWKPKITKASTGSWIKKNLISVCRLFAFHLQRHRPQSKSREIGSRNPVMTLRCKLRKTVFLKICHAGISQKSIKTYFHGRDNHCNNFRFAFTSLSELQWRYASQQN